MRCRASYGFFRRIFLPGTIYFFFLVALLTPSLAQASFSDANDRYSKGDFTGAVPLYEKQVESGERSAALYYNLGNAYFRSGQKGKAMLSFVRAMDLSPRDQDIRWNINLLRSALADRIVSSDSNPFIYYVNLAVGIITPDEAAICLTLVLMLYLAIAIIGFLFPRIKVGLRGLKFLILLAGLAAAFIFIWKVYDLKEPRVIVLEKEVTARFGPSAKETKAFLLHEGASAKVLDTVNDWYYVGLASGSAGWIPKKSCEVV